MKILRSYILKELIFPFCLSLGVLTGVFLLGSLVQLTNMVINKGVSLILVGRLFILYIPLLLGYTLPIACLTAVIMTFSRLSADNEILAIRTSGIYMRHILTPLVIIGLIMSLFVFVLNNKLIPYANYEQRKIIKNIGVQNPTAVLEAGSFIKAFKDQILFIYRIDDNKLYNVRIYQPQGEGKPTRTIVAKRGEFTPVPGEKKIKLKLMDGTSDEPNLEDPNNFYKLNFKNYFMTLDLSKDYNEIEKKPKGMTTRELKEKITELEKLLVNTAPLKTEYYRKFTSAFAVLVFLLLGFPIAVITHRREKTANVVLAVMCAVIYYLLDLGCEALCIQSIVPISITMWAPNILGASVAAFLNYRLCVS